MTLLAEYYVPGLHVEDRSIKVPLDWTGHEPGQGFDGESIDLFYRVVTAPEHVHDDLPLLVFLQGGPGGPCPRLMGPDHEMWVKDALKRFRIVLPDQRGVGRSSAIDSHVMARFDSARAQADYLKRFLAGSIVRDFEHLRRTEFGGRKWVSLGQSYGGFLTLSYLSLYPEGLLASFTTGGIPYVAADADAVYQHTFPRMIRKNEQFYERYPQDVERVAAIADILDSSDVHLPNGDPFSVRRLQLLGSDFGMKPSFERLHWLLDTAFVDGDGGASRGSYLTDGFLMGVLTSTQTYNKPLYWTLQEFIYANGDCKPIRWAAQRERDRHPEFDPAHRPLMFTGEASFPWMFEEGGALIPFHDAMDLLMEDGHWDTIYDVDQLARNEVPLQAAVYYDDMYVDSTLQLKTLSNIGNSHAWVTNEYEHDGVHSNHVFQRLFNEALNRGDLEALF
ncbi:proline iminopeptidase [Bifidobacterium ramosum]|uniref:Alpha/beta fold hydrolase n=1 Tax=Bifidobacterium ramosum TaxID=1798158 RepID=A0A6L4X205_9BIFI|nr:alpha/beta fold hydrolase [Bifidobacterium ramosum]KAB8289041.1 proline iminopeptidase [Bifidobacterium ramosum]NEG70755.1 alpha/beta fold hydrolase [Bifidobacterium ramosum]